MEHRILLSVTGHALLAKEPRPQAQCRHLRAGGISPFDLIYQRKPKNPV